MYPDSYLSRHVASPDSFSCACPRSNRGPSLVRAITPPSLRHSSRYERVRRRLRRVRLSSPMPWPRGGRLRRTFAATSAAWLLTTRGMLSAQAESLYLVVESVSGGAFGARARARRCRHRYCAPDTKPRPWSCAAGPPKASGRTRATVLEAPRPALPPRPGRARSVHEVMRREAAGVEYASSRRAKREAPG